MSEQKRKMEKATEEALKEAGVEAEDVCQLHTYILEQLILKGTASATEKQEIGKNIINN